MKNNQTEKNENTYDREFRLLQSFIDSYYADSQTDLYNSTQLRSLLDDSYTSSISTKTFDKGIRLINEVFSLHTNENPAFLNQSELNEHEQPLHTHLFFQRLPSCLCIDMSNSDLYCKQLLSDEQRTAKDRPDSRLGFSPSNDSTSSIYTYTFDIHKFKMPPFFAPLFIGIIGSLSKEKSSWTKFRENALDISEAFYNEKHPEINQFLSENADMRIDLYDYWLDLHFPDELFNLLSKFDDIINKNKDPLLSHNLYILANERLSQDIILIRTMQNEFIRHMTKTLELYLDTPMIDPNTLEPRDIDLFKEHDDALQKFCNEEKCLIKKLHSKQNITS